MIKNTAKELEILGKEKFKEMRSTMSDIEPSLTELEYYCLTKVKEGYSVSYLARNVFNVHVVTLQKSLSSVNYINALHDLNNAQTVVTMQTCLMRLSDIILNSKNEQSVISAIKVMMQITPLITMAELEEALVRNNLEAGEAQELLAKFSINDDEDKEE